MTVRFLPPRSDDSDRQSAPEPGRIPVADIEELVAAGEAIALMPEFDVGPTWYQDMWWIVPTGEWDRGFAVASEQDQAEFSRMFLRLHRSQQLHREHQRRAEKLREADELTADERAALREADRIADRGDPDRPRGLTGRWKRPSSW